MDDYEVQRVVCGEHESEATNKHFCFESLLHKRGEKNSERYGESTSTRKDYEIIDLKRAI